MLAILFSTMLLQTSAPPPFFQKDDQKGSKGHAVVDLSTDVGWIGPGQEFHIVVAITPDAGWHTYWENPGDSGAATEIEVGAPEGYRVGKPIFPRPEIFITANETTYGYSKQVCKIGNKCLPWGESEGNLGRTIFRAMILIGLLLQPFAVVLRITGSNAD